MDFSRRMREVKQATIKPPYIYSFVAIILAYLGLNFYINQFYVTLPLFFSFNLAFVLPYAVLTILISLLVAANINLIICKTRALASVKGMKNAKKEGTFTALGTFGGLLGGACPGCFVGLLPTVAGGFGLTLSLSALPFKGFEIQLPTAVMLFATLLLLTRRNACSVKLAAR